MPTRVDWIQLWDKHRWLCLKPLFEWRNLHCEQTGQQLHAGPDLYAITDRVMHHRLPNYLSVTVNQSSCFIFTLPIKIKLFVLLYRIELTSTSAIVFLAIMVLTVSLTMMSVRPLLAKMMETALWVLYSGSSEVGMQLTIINFLC